MRRNRAFNGAGIGQPGRRSLPIVAAAAAMLLASAVPAAAGIVTVFTDTAAADGSTIPGTGLGNAGDLRQQMLAATSGDTIAFACNAPPCTVTLNGPLPPITANLTINGGTAGNIIIDGNELYRAFFIDNGTITLKNLVIQNVRAKGGDGGSGARSGGGGAGLGAGVFIRQGTVTLENVAFSNAAARGGNGGGNGTTGVGGGGGLGGTGGSSNITTAGNGGGGILGDGLAGSGSTGGDGGAGNGGGGGGSMGGASSAAGSAYAGTTAGSGGNAITGGSIGGQGGFGGGGGSGAAIGGGGAGGFGGGGAGGGSGGLGGGAGGQGGGGGGSSNTALSGGNGGSLGGGANGGAGNTAGMGGGGAAAGPAVFVAAGTLLTVASTSTGHTAIGGTGANAGLGVATATFNLGGTVNGSTGNGPVADALPQPTYDLTVAAVGGGTVTSAPAGITCPGACSAAMATFTGINITSVTLTAAASPGSTFAGWSGNCQGAAATATVTMSAARACTATFLADSGPAPTPTPVPTPPPAFVSTANPPPTVLTVDTTGAGKGAVSLASSFTGTPGLSFTATQASGTPLPSWLTFDPATVSFDYNVPLPADLPIQLSADPVARAARATRSAVNTVYPLSVRVATIPVSLTAVGGGQSYTATISMDFYAPRTPVAMTAISYAPANAGNAPSSRPALSWDGGQVVFETLATNINPASGGYSSIARYHGLSGRRDLLSQTAIPGGGVANGADGPSSNPAVSASGNFAAFSSAAPGVSMTPNNRLRQVYRTSLAYPRVSLNEAATPAAVMISATVAGIAADAAADLPAIAEQGRFVAFESAAGNLGDNPDRLSQIWRKDADGGAIVLVSSSAGGVAGNGDSRNVSLSWDGTLAVFDSTATNLVPGGSAGRHVFLKNLGNGQVFRLSAQGGSGNAKIDARGAGVVYVATVGTASQVLRYDIASGVTTVVSVTPSGVGGNGDSTQATMSADGRFVAFRSTATDLVAGYVGNGQAQVWIRDVMRGVTALVTQTQAGAPGNGASSEPALSGDGASIAFTSLARDLVNGTPLPGQIHLAGNPLPLPDKTGYWYIAAANGGQGWLMERWGNQAYIGGLVYDTAGRPGWVTGLCRLAGLSCSGTLSSFAGGAPFGAAGGVAPAPTPAAAATLTTAADGRSTTLQLGNGAAQTLTMFPIGGTATTGYAGLPQAGWWVETGATGGNGYFIAVDSQAQANGAVAHIAYVSVLTFDGAGRSIWYSSQAALGADLSFTGTLMQYGGGAPLGQTQAGTSGAMPVGTLRIAFTAGNTARISLPNGRNADIGRLRF